MAVSDPIADMLTRIRNAITARHENVVVPASRMKLYIAKILKQEGFITDYEVMGNQPHREIKIILRYDDNNRPVISGLKRVSKPGLRVYSQRNEIPRIFGGQGIAILSTSKGVMTGSKAWHNGIGGELLCYVW
ncbi:MAG: 30S ribosomal protein S8 [Dehalococcoidia bacterium]|nr:MAG: 30S ribosomal protein S8 [Dehalococcoidia bacterium]